MCAPALNAGRPTPFGRCNTTRTMSLASCARSAIETDIVFIATYCPRLVSPCHSGKTQLGHALSWIELTDGGVCAPGTFIFD